MIYCTYEYTKVGSKGAAIAVELLVGAHAKVATGELTMSIYNGVDSSLLWSFNKIMDQELHSSSDDITTRLIGKVTRNFPYKKE